MGRVKDYWLDQEEQWARGFLPPDRGGKYVCASHFDNCYLKRFITQKMHTVGYALIAARRNW